MQNHNAFEEVNSSLEIDECLKHQQRGFLLQRMGIIGIGLIVLLAAVGLFGDGVLSVRRASSGNVRILYQRFYRNEAKMEFKAEVSNVAASVSISFPPEYVDKMDMVSVKPEPSFVQTVDGRHVYTFKGNGEVRVIFRLEPRSAGNISGRITIQDQAFDVRHFIFP